MTLRWILHFWRGVLELAPKMFLTPKGPKAQTVLEYMPRAFGIVRKSMQTLWEFPAPCYPVLLPWVPGFIVARNEPKECPSELRNTGPGWLGLLSSHCLLETSAHDMLRCCTHIYIYQRACVCVCCVHTYKHKHVCICVHIHRGLEVHWWS